MAVRRSGGVVGYAVGLVVFVVLFVAALVASVLFYTQANGLQMQKEKAEAELARMIKPAERSQPELEKLVGEIAGKGDSVVGSLYNENRMLKKAISGDVAMPAEKIEQVAGIEKGRMLVSELKRFSSELDSANRMVQNLKDQLASAQKQIEAYDREKRAIQSQFDQSANQLKSQLADLQGKQTSYENAAKGKQQELEGRISQAQADKQKAVSEVSALVQQQKQKIVQLESRLDQMMLIRSGGSKTDVDPTLQPDGRIIAVSADQTTVYIDRGRANHVPLGLTFAVYDANTKIDRDRAEQLAGKASVEVIRVTDVMCEARVVRREKGQQIQEGDTVANLAYDSSVVYKFYVFGDFDLDRTGTPTMTDKKRVESLIAGWGSRTVEQLSYDTDFLILGVEPVKPKTLPSGENRPDVIEKWAAEKRRYDEYQRLTAEAAKFKIPVMNQNRFLELVGYHQR